MALVVLDRDGVINEDSDQFIRSVADWQPVPGSLEAIARLNRAGFEVVLFTNQSGVARGYLTETTLGHIHQHLQERLAAVGGALRGIYYCPHGPDDGCDCRKPQPGLLHQIERDLGRTLQGVPVVGDSLRDLEAALAVGAKPILVKTGKGQRTLQQALPPETEVFADLAAVVERLLTASK